MKTAYYFLATHQYEHECTKWLQTVNSGESVSVLFIPKTDRFVRLGQLLNDRSLVVSALGSDAASKILLQRIYVEAHDVEEADDLYQLIAAQVNASKFFSEKFTFAQLLSHLQKHKLTLVLIIPDAEKFLTPQGKTVLSHLSYLAEEHSNHIRIISFFETDIMHPTLLPLLPSLANLYDNVFHYPLYSEEHTRDFVKLLQGLWNVTVSKKHEDAVIENCGGHLWLVKEAIRSLSSAGKWNPDEEGMLFRLRTIYSLFLPTEQSTLQKIIEHKNNFNHDERVSYDHMVQMNVLSRQGKLLLGGITRYLKSHENFTGVLSMADGKIHLNQIPIDMVFSRKEKRIMRLFLERKNDVVTRDDIAQCMWPLNTTDQYSDWAIDQMITRIRKRLMTLSVPARLIQAVRGRGYRMNATE